jgi:hypothetical protein
MFLGLSSGTAGLPNSNFSSATQAIHFCRIVDHVCEIWSSAAWARKILGILGTAIGMYPKEALFKGYIDLEVEVSI